MKVQTKLFLLLLLVAAAFIGGLAFIYGREHSKFRQIICERATQREQYFDEFLKRRGVPLEMVAKDYTYWDAMVQAIAAPDPAWIKANVNEANWGNSDAHALWIYRPDHTLLYSGNRLDADDLNELPLASGIFDALEKERLMHFYMPLPQGNDPNAPPKIMEVRAATVHPSTDSARRTPPQGFFFVGRLWSNDVIDSYARDTDNFIRLLRPDAPDTDNGDDVDNGVVAFTRKLRGWDGQIVAQLLVRNDLATIRELNHASERLVVLLVVFALAVVALFSLSLTRWVNRPMRLISQALKTEQLAPIETLDRNRDEFGGLARLIREFFGQRANLIAEINERKNAQEALRHSGEQLRQAQKMEAVGRLAGGVAHDFNNLLTAILGYAELLAARHDLDASARQNVETIQKAGRQAAAVTHQLLAFSRKQVLQPRVIELGALVHDFEKILRRVIGEHIELSTQADPGGGRVRADPNQIEQVILNLGVNARDAMPKGGQLRIRTGNVVLNEEAAREQAADLGAGRYALLEVSDTGMGMDEETQARIFEPFFTTKGPGKGTGLGLATVYGVVRQSGGAISVQSAPGKGSTFRIYLPLEEGEPEDARPKTVAPTNLPSRLAETVLVVEDEEIVRDLVCTVLKEGGYEVLCAPNGTEGLRLSEQHAGNISLLITDVVMPQMGGLELSRAVMAQRPEVRVLYVSGYSENDMNEQGILAAGLDFLEKPFTPQALKRKVREVLNPLAVAATQRDRAFDSAQL